MIEKVFCESFHHSFNYKRYTKECVDNIDSFMSKLNRTELESLETIITRLKEISGTIIANTNVLKSNYQVLIGISNIFSNIIENFVYLLFLVIILFFFITNNLHIFIIIFIEK